MDEVDAAESTIARVGFVRGCKSKWATADVLRQCWSRVASGPQRAYRGEVEVHYDESAVLHMGFDPHEC